MTRRREYASGSGREIGDDVRLLVLGALLAAVAACGVAARDPFAPYLFLLLVLLPRRFPLFRLFRSLNPTVSAGLLVLALFVLAPLEIGLSRALPAEVTTRRLLAHLVMLLAITLVPRIRFTAREFHLLMGAGFLLVLISIGAPHPSIRLLLLLFYAGCCTAALVRAHMRTEEQRVLDLARVRGFERGEAEEVVGRGADRSRPLTRGILLLGLSVVLLGLALAAGVPFAARGVRAGWGLLAGSGGRPNPLPEAGEGPPRFEIPPGVKGPRAFGLRLDRDEFQARRRSDRLVCLVRPFADARFPVPDLVLRGECYDYLTGQGVWIRSRFAEREIRDGEDGSPDGRVTLTVPLPASLSAITVLLAPALDPTVYTLPNPARVAVRRLLEDGTGNLIFPAGLRPAGPYRVESRALPPPPGTPLASPGPQFLLLPADVDRERLAGLVEPLRGSGVDAASLAAAVSRHLRFHYLHFEDDSVPSSFAKGAGTPARLDVVDFLFRRRWGNNLDFATALALLLRSVGIPCRLVTGYREGRTVLDADFTVFRSGDLHAWVEVPLEGGYWVGYDPTPESLDDLSRETLGGIFGKSSAKRAKAVEEALEEAKRPTLIRRIVDAVDAFVAKILPGGIGAGPIGKALAWLALLLIAGFVLRSSVFVATRGRTLFLRGGSHAEEAGIFLFYERLLALLARYGMRRRRQQTPLEFARAVVRSWGGEFSEVERLTNAFCAHRYGEIPIAPGETRALLARVASLGRMVRERTRREKSARAARRKAAGAAVLLIALLLGSTAAGAGGFDNDVAALGAESVEVRAGARKVLLKAGRAAVPALLAVLGAKAPPAQALVLSGAPVRADLTRRRGALWLLARIGPPEAADAIAQTGISSRALLRDAVEALAYLARRDLAAVLPLLERTREDLVVLTAEALGRSGLGEARPHLLRLIGSPSLAVAKAARDALVTPEVVERTDRARGLLNVRNEVEAEAELRAVLRLCPGYPEAGLLLVALLEKRAGAGKALEVLRTLSLPPAERAWREARLLVALGDREGAQARLVEVLRLRPGYTPAALLRARLLLAEKNLRLTKILHLLDTATRLDPGSAEAWALLGRFHGRYLHGRPMALRCLEKALALDPGNEAWRREWRRYRDR